MTLFKTEFQRSVRFKFLGVISGILFVSTVVLSTVIAINERGLLRHSLLTKGQSFASYIAKLSIDPLIMKDGIQLDTFVNEANKDEDILYAIIQNAQGNIITSQYSSVNYQSPRLKAILPELSKNSELPDIIAAIKKNEVVTEISTPILSGAYTIGNVIICMSQHNIRIQIVKTIVFVIALNAVVALALGAVLFVSSKKMILTPVAELAIAAARLAKGALSTQVTVKATGELQMLVDSFNQMAADLEKTTVSRDYVDSIIHSMADTLIVVNPDGMIKTVNAALMSLLGYEEEMVGKPLGVVLADGTAAADGLAHAIAKEGWVNSVETFYLSRIGKRIPILASGASIQDMNGIYRGFALIGKDITERKQAEDRLYRYALELKESNNEIQSFSYIISHDLRAPLVSIKGFSSELAYVCKEIETVIGKHLPNMDGKDRDRLELLLKQDIDEALKFIASSADRMDGLINSILALSRVGRRELTPEPVDMDGLTRGIIDSLAHQIGEKNIRVTLGELPVITADRLAMEQVMGNLLDNAVKYFDAERPGELSMTAEKTFEETVFHVRDNGRGIAADDIHKVFEIFKRVGKQDTPGEGMGLAYVKALVKRHGGRIWCESEPGKGSVFSFTISHEQGKGEE